MKKIFLLCLFLFNHPYLFSESSYVDIIMFSYSSTIKLTRHELKAMYLMRTRYLPDGYKVTLFQFPEDNPIHNKFIREILGISVSQYNREINKTSNTGTNINNIITVKTKTEMIKSVSTTNNSIGYLDSNTFLMNFDSTGDNDVKRIIIID